MAAPTDHEQYVLEMINRARLDPLGEAARYGIDLNQGLSGGTLNGTPKQPLAFNPKLIDAAPEAFSHALINEYRPGTQLGWHRDVPEFERVVGVSLAGSCRMRFRPYPARKGARVFVLDLEPRSVYVLRDEIRWRWQHSVAPTQALRYSVTFRTRR